NFSPPDTLIYGIKPEIPKINVHAPRLLRRYILFLEFYTVIAADKNVTEFPRLRHALILSIAYSAIVTLGARWRDETRLMMNELMAVKMDSESQNGLRVIGSVGSHLDRRQFLGWGSAALLHKATQEAGRHQHTGAETSEFRIPLPIPSVLNPVRTDATTDYYEVVQREAWAEIIP